jgi:hypothetical protein
MSAQFLKFFVSFPTKGRGSLAASNCGDEGPDAWLSGRSSTCVELRADGPAGVIMEEYSTNRRGQMTNGHALVA